MENREAFRWCRFRSGANRCQLANRVRQPHVILAIERRSFLGARFLRGGERYAKVHVFALQLRDGQRIARQAAGAQHLLPDPRTVRAWYRCPTRQTKRLKRAECLLQAAQQRKPGNLPFQAEPIHVCELTCRQKFFFLVLFLPTSGVNRTSASKLPFSIRFGISE